MKTNQTLVRRQSKREALLVRPILEGMRAVVLLAVAGLTALFLSGGLAQLYVDSSALDRASVQDVLPTLAEIRNAWQVHQDTLLETHIPGTLWATLTGLSIAVALGLGLAALMDLLPPVRWVVYPILVLSQTIPTFAIAVLLILLFGFGFGPKIVVVVLFCFFPITVSTLDGLRSVNPLHMALFRSMGASPWQTWRKVRLPTAMPAFFSGLRLAATYSIVGAVIGEFVGAGDGLGKFLQRSYRSFNTDQVFLAVIIIAVLSVLLVFLVSLVELLALRWRFAGRRVAPGSWRSWLAAVFDRLRRSLLSQAAPATTSPASSELKGKVRHG